MDGSLTLTREDGATIAYTSEGSGTPVVFLQGVGVPGCGWSPQTDALRADHQVVSVDNRGLGGSTLVGPVSLPQMAEDALAVMDALELESAHLVGHSMGGLIAEQMALTAPGRARSLALLCTPLNGPAGASMNPRMMWIGMRMRIGTRPSRRRAFLELFYSRAERAAHDLDASAESLRPIFGRDLADSPPIVMKQVRAMSKHDALPRLGELKDINTLIVCGEEDPIAPPTAGREKSAAIPGSRFLTMEGAHGIPITRVDEMNVLLREHFGENQR